MKWALWSQAPAYVLPRCYSSSVQILPSSSHIQTHFFFFLKDSTETGPSGMQFRFRDAHKLSAGIFCWRAFRHTDNIVKCLNGCLLKFWARPLTGDYCFITLQNTYSSFFYSTETHILWKGVLLNFKGGNPYHHVILKG